MIRNARRSPEAPPTRQGFSLLAGLLLALGTIASPAHAETPAFGARPGASASACPAGTSWIDGRCAAPQTRSQQCPPGTVGYYPTCRPAVQSTCPPGTTGVYPSCRPTLLLPPPLATPQYHERRTVAPRLIPPLPDVRFR
jgi:hypothetical protein